MERRPLDRVRGTQDLWPAEAPRVERVRRELEATFATFGYRRVDVPVLEQAELHLRKSGLEIVSKLYAFDDLGGRRLCLRPELTASIVRALVAQPAPRLPTKLYSSGPVFRYERPSRGRYRQFTQCGVELVGAGGPLADAETIALAMSALDRLGLTAYRVTVGHVGVLADLLTKLGLTGRLRGQLMESLEAARRHGLAAVRAQLHEFDPELFEGPAAEPVAGPNPQMEDSGNPAGEGREQITALLAQMGAERLGRRTEHDVVERLLRKLQPGTQGQAIERALDFIGRLGGVRGRLGPALAAGRTLLEGYGIPDEPLRSLERTVELLPAFGVDPERVEVDLGLSRGLQYYTGMVFEIDHAGLGAESQLCGGGRYDDLFRALGARQPVPALGFAFGVERVRLAAEAEGLEGPLADESEVYVVPAGPEVVHYAVLVAGRIREGGGQADLDVTGRSLRAALAFAGRQGYRTVAVVGEAEAEAGTVRLRDMESGDERSVPLAEVGSPGPAATLEAIG